ncbi:MAG: type VII secretion protein EccE [Actinocatenispora sp.]
MVMTQAAPVPAQLHDDPRDDPFRDGQVRFGPRRGRRRFGGVRVTQFVLVETAVAVLLLATGLPAWYLPGAGLVALALLFLAFGRTGGRWWTEWLLLRRRFSRRRGAAGAPTDDARLAALRRLVPHLSVRTVEERGSRIGVGQDDAGWFTAVAVVPRSGLRGDPGDNLPLDAIARVLDEGGLRVSAVQVVLHSIPAPAALLDDGAPAARSYRQLASGDMGVQPIEQRCWVVVRLDPATAAQAAATRGGGLDGVHRALSNAVGRLGKAIGGAGLEYEVLDGEGLLDALARSCGVNGYVDQHTARQIREQWSAWHAGGLAHTSFWVRDWPGLGEVGGLLGRLARTPAVQTDVAISMEPREDGTDLQCVVRLAAQPGQLDASCHALRQLARVGRVRLFRLNGEQGPAVYSTAPTGGGAR